MLCIPVSQLLGVQIFSREMLSFSIVLPYARRVLVSTTEIHCLGEV